jgi:hypothetical protein
VVLVLAIVLTVAMLAVAVANLPRRTRRALGLPRQTIVATAFEAAARADAGGAMLGVRPDAAGPDRRSSRPQRESWTAAAAR